MPLVHIICNSINIDSCVERQFLGFIKADAKMDVVQNVIAIGANATRYLSYIWIWGGVKSRQTNRYA